MSQGAGEVPRASHSYVVYRLEPNRPQPRPQPRDAGFCFINNRELRSTQNLKLKSPKKYAYPTVRTALTGPT